MSFMIRHYSDNILDKASLKKQDRQYSYASPFRIIYHSIRCNFGRLYETFL